jgi:hypothetical protein
MNVCKVRSESDRSMSNKLSGEVRPYSGSSSMQVQGTNEPNIVQVGAAPPSQHRHTAFEFCVLRNIAQISA